MNLDDRIRSAQRTQLDAVEAQVRARGLDVHQATRPPRRPYAVALLAAAAGLALLFQVGPRLLSEPTVSVESPASDGVDLTALPTSTTSVTVEVGEATTATTATSATQPTPTQPTPTPLVTADVVTAAGQPSESTAPAQQDLDPGVANNVCSSGRRATLERADLEYISGEKGWNRKGDLVNEQDGPFYFGLWEPDYPGTVSVEVTLDAPVQATEILLAQHPYQDVSGVITVDIAGVTVPIQLSGRDGFKSHSFDQPVVVESFVITRSEAAANITEVIVCVAEL